MVLAVGYHGRRSEGGYIMQKLVTLCLRCEDTTHGAVEEHLEEFLDEDWRVVSVTGVGTAVHDGQPVMWLAVVLEQGTSSFAPAMEFPQSEAGYPVEPSGVAIDVDTPLEIGSVVLSFSQERWWRAEIIGFEGENHVKIHYPGWGDEWDVVVPREELQVCLESGDDD